MMRRFFVVTCLLCFFSMDESYSAREELFSELDLTRIDFAAPIIYDRSTLTGHQAGTLIYDSQDNAFYGASVTGTWIQLSPPLTDGYVESMSSSLQTLSSLGVTASSWFDLTSITLDPGEWDITAVAVAYANATLASENRMVLAVGRYSGDNATGLAWALNQVGAQKSDLIYSADELTVPSYRVNITTSTTYYLKFIYVNNITDVSIGFRISARKIR